MSAAASRRSEVPDQPRRFRSRPFSIREPRNGEPGTEPENQRHDGDREGHITSLLAQCFVLGPEPLNLGSGTDTAALGQPAAALDFDGCRTSIRKELGALDANALRARSRNATSKASTSAPSLTGRPAYRVAQARQSPRPCPRPGRRQSRPPARRSQWREYGALTASETPSTVPPLSVLKKGMNVGVTRATPANLLSQFQVEWSYYGAHWRLPTSRVAGGSASACRCFTSFRTTSSLVRKQRTF